MYLYGFLVSYSYYLEYFWDIRCECFLVLLSFRFVGVVEIMMLVFIGDLIWEVICYVVCGFWRVDLWVVEGIDIFCFWVIVF